MAEKPVPGGVQSSARATVDQAVKNTSSARDGVDQPAVHKTMGPSSRKLGIIFGIGTFLFIGGVALGASWSYIFDSILFNQLILSPTSMSYGMWKETPIPMYLRIHLFNWTNPEDFAANATVKPNFVEMGPYVFREVDYKVEQVWNDNGTITHERKRVWNFEESMSKGALSDEVTNLNVVATTAAYILRDEPPLVRKIANSILKNLGAQLTVTKTVRELLFDGYNDTFLTLAKKLNLSGIDYDKFGWFYSRNASSSFDGTFNMLTGKLDVHGMGLVKEWKYSNETPYSGSCAAVRGSLGDFWPPQEDNKETVAIFSPDICAPVDLTFEGTPEFLGLTGYKYSSDESTLDNGTKVASRACYCGDNVECQPSGVMNVSLCRSAPAFISFPHFYLADESYRNAITGMSPDKDAHEFYMTVEPALMVYFCIGKRNLSYCVYLRYVGSTWKALLTATLTHTGVPLQVRAKLQINVLVREDPYISLFKDAPDVYIPMLWFSQDADLSSEYSSQIKFLLTLPLLGHVTFFGLCGIGVLLICIGIFLIVRSRWREEESQNLITTGENKGVARSDG